MQHSEDLIEEEDEQEINPIDELNPEINAENPENPEINPEENAEINDEAPVAAAPKKRGRPRKAPPPPPAPPPAKARKTPAPKARVIRAPPKERTRAAPAAQLKETSGVSRSLAVKPALRISGPINRLFDINGNPVLPSHRSHPLGRRPGRKVCNWVEQRHDIEFDV